jgi:hypothetical protein
VEWITAEEACTTLGVGAVKLARWVDDGTLVAEGLNGAFMFRRTDIEHLAAHRPRRRKHVAHALVDGNDKLPAMSDEELEQARLIGQFIEAAVNGLPGPCPVCGFMLRQSRWPVHLLEHRA